MAVAPSSPASARRAPPRAAPAPWGGAGPLPGVAPSRRDSDRRWRASVPPSEAVPDARARAAARGRASAHARAEQELRARAQALRVHGWGAASAPALPAARATVRRRGRRADRRGRDAAPGALPRLAPGAFRVAPDAFPGVAPDACRASPRGSGRISMRGSGRASRRGGIGGASGSVCHGGGSSIIGCWRGARAGGGAGAGSGCSGHILFSFCTARGSASGGRCGAPSRAGAPARTILASTTTSLGPPIISRCSTLSRRIRIRRRRPSTAAASITASRGWRPRDEEAPRRSPAEAAHQKGGHADQGEHDDECEDRIAPGAACPRQIGNPLFLPAPTGTASSAGRIRIVNADGNICRREY